MSVEEPTRSPEDTGNSRHGVGSHDQHDVLLGFNVLENLKSLRTIATPWENMDRRHSPAR